MTFSILRAMIVLAIAVYAPQLLAQPQQQQADVLKVVTTLFDGMKAKDTTKMRSTFAPNARLMTASVRNGAPAVSEAAIDAWIAQIGRSQQSLEEKIFSPEVRIDGNLATVWTKYEFWANGTRSHCGFDSFQLALTATGWKIIHVADSRRTDCG